MAIKYCLNVDFSIQEVRFQPSLCAHSHSPNPSLSSPLSPSTSFQCAVSCVSTYCCPKNVQWTTCHWLLPTSCNQQKLYLTQMINKRPEFMIQFGSKRVQVDADDELSIHLLYTVGVIVFNLAKYTFTAWTLPLVLQGTTQTSCSREKPSAPCKPARADQKSPERKQSVSAKPE